MIVEPVPKFRFDIVMTIPRWITSTTDDSATADDAVHPDDDGEEIFLSEIVMLDPRRHGNVTLDKLRLGKETLEELCQKFWQTNRVEFWRHALALLDTCHLEKVAAFVGVTGRTMRSWNRSGVFPRPLEFGWKKSYWFVNELEVAECAFSDRWNFARRRYLTQGLMLRRFVLLTQLLHLCDLEGSNEGFEESATERHPHHGGAKQLKYFCRPDLSNDVSQSPEGSRTTSTKFDLLELPITARRAINMISDGTFPIETERSARGHHLVESLEILRAHLQRALRETPLPVLQVKRLESPSIGVQRLVFFGPDPSSGDGDCSGV